MWSYLFENKMNHFVNLAFVNRLDAFPNSRFTCWKIKRFQKIASAVALYHDRIVNKCFFMDLHASHIAFILT